MESEEEEEEEDDEDDDDDDADAEEEDDEDELLAGCVWRFLPRPYKGITFSLVTPALQMGHSPRPLFSNHLKRHGQQYRCPHWVITGSVQVKRQILQSKLASLSSSSDEEEEVEDFCADDVAVLFSSVFDVDVAAASLSLSFSEDESLLLIFQRSARWRKGRTKQKQTHKKAKKNETNKN